MAHPIPEAALARTTAIVGTTGAGKSYAARSAVENLLDAGRRVCVVDPTGVWYGLRTSAAGDAPGYPMVIFGGDHSDVPIGEHAGPRLAEVVATRGVSCVVDISELGIGARHRFMTDFLGELYARNKAALHLILDEADELAPQNPLPETRRLLHATDRIIRRGRVRGFRPMLITQRPAVIHKNVLSQIGCLVALKLTSPQDRKAIEDWVKGHADASEAKGVLDTLAKLKTGEGWVWWPEGEVLQRTKFPRIRTADTSRAPDDDEEVAEVRPLAPVEVDELRALVAEAEEEEPAPQARIEYRTDTKAIERARQVGRSEGYKAAIDAVTASLAHLRSNALDFKEAPAARPRNDSTPPAPTPAPNASGAPAARAARKERPARRPVAGGVPSAAQKILAVLSTDPPIRLTWSQAGALAGLKARGGHFNAGRRWLLDSGLLIEEGDTIRARSSGGAPAPRSAEEWLAAWSAVLPALSGEILALLVRCYPAAQEKEEIAGILGKQPRGGHWNNGLAQLRQNRLIKEHGKGIRAAAWLFGDAQ